MQSTRMNTSIQPTPLLSTALPSRIRAYALTMVLTALALADAALGTHFVDLLTHSRRGIQLVTGCDNSGCHRNRCRNRLRRHRKFRQQHSHGDPKRRSTVNLEGYFVLFEALISRSIKRNLLVRMMSVRLIRNCQSNTNRITIASTNAYQYATTVLNTHQRAPIHTALHSNSIH